jgi:hypothetical protein
MYSAQIHAGAIDGYAVVEFNEFLPHLLSLGWRKALSGLRRPVRK